MATSQTTVIVGQPKELMVSAAGVLELGTILSNILVRSKRVEKKKKKLYKGGNSR